jgi:hypothetical protein
MKRNG